MTRSTLLATTAAILFPLAGAFAQSTGADGDMTTGTTGTSASGDVSVQGDVDGANENDMTDSLSDSANEAANDVGEAADQAMDTAGDVAEDAADTAGQVGDAAASTAEDALEDTSQAADNAADAVSPEAGDTAAADAGALTVGELTGRPVIDAAGEEVGEIDMVVSDGTVTSAVIGVGGFLGIGEHSVALPMRDLRMSADGGLELAGYTKEDLGRMPEFEDEGAQVLEAEASVPDLG